MTGKAFKDDGWPGLRALPSRSLLDKHDGVFDDDLLEMLSETSDPQPLDPDLVARAAALVEGVEVDLDAPLSSDDD